jgi:hypothetical protein
MLVNDWRKAYRVSYGTAPLWVSGSTRVAPVPSLPTGIRTLRRPDPDFPKVRLLCFPKSLCAPQRGTPATSTALVPPNANELDSAARSAGI